MTQNKRGVCDLMLIAFLTGLMPMPLSAQYFGIENRQRSAVDVDFHAEHLKEQKQESFLEAKRNLSIDLIERCEKELSEAVVNVTLTNDDGHVLFNDKSLVELSKGFSDFRKNNSVTYTFSSTQAKNAYSYSIETQSIHEGLYSCISPRLNIEIKQERQEINIANEIKPEGCLEQSVLAHELRRMRHNNEVAKQLQIEIKKRSEYALAHIGIVYGNQQQINRWLSGVVSKHFEPIVKEAEKDLLAIHTGLDEIEQSDYFLYVCQGEGFAIIEALESRHGKR